MANPQAENGHTDIANELLEAKMRVNLSGSENQVWEAIARLTYGWHKKEDWITVSRIAHMTNMIQPHVSRAIRKLLMRNMITKNGNRQRVIYGIQKNYDLWKPLPKKVRYTNIGNEHTKIGMKLIPKLVDTKEKKETIQKKSNMSTSQFVDLYHRLLPFGSKVVSLTKTRKAHINARLKQHPDPQFWTDLFARCARSKFLRGEIPPREGYKQFKINIEFITNENKIAKILEGEYDDRSGKPRQLTWRERQDLIENQKGQRERGESPGDQEGGEETGTGGSDF